ncbi:MAG TPA: TauD/TfdA family dioxygenase [Novosphingobium sp.]|nr:TauD/TfdA family dioxygenase [Novosphingobium sp.]
MPSDSTASVAERESGSVAFRQLGGVFGAEVRGIDLSRPLGQSEVEAIRSGLDVYRVLVFRGQHDVAPRQLLDFAACFGEPETAEHPHHPDFEGVPGVKVLINNAADFQDRAHDTWHTDGATRDDTRYLTILQAIDVPPCGRDTLFADMVTAYDRLSETMKAILDGLVGENSWGMSKPGAPSVYHPIIFRDPRTGRKSIYANKLYTRSIQGLRNDESDLLLKFLFEQARTPEFQLRVNWEPGTIAMWNNETTQHYLVFDTAYDRVMHRVMVA